MLSGDTRIISWDMENRLPITLASEESLEAHAGAIEKVLKDKTLFY